MEKRKRMKPWAKDVPSWLQSGGTVAVVDERLRDMWGNYLYVIDYYTGQEDGTVEVAWGSRRCPGRVGGRRSVMSIDEAVEEIQRYRKNNVELYSKYGDSYPF